MGAAAGGFRNTAIPIQGPIDQNGEIRSVFNFWEDEHYKNTDIINLRKSINRILTSVKMHEVVVYVLIRRDIRDILLGGKSWQINTHLLY